MTQGIPHDVLLTRLRERIADPARRLDERASAFMGSVADAGLGGVLTMGRSLGRDLLRLVQGGPDADTVARAGALRETMETPADRALPARATTEQVEAAEGRLGFELPPLLRRLYGEIANGGFGPGPGILGIAGGWANAHGATVEDLYEQVREVARENGPWSWPHALLPIVDSGSAYTCLDCAATDGGIVDFDFEELDERGRDGGWSRAFTDRAPSLGAWLVDWLESPSAEERRAAQMAEAMAAMTTTIPEVTREYWAAMTPEQRAEYGLPEKGWGRALFGDAWGDDPRDGSGT